MEVRASLLNHNDWEDHALNRATILVQHVQQLQSAGQDTLPSLTLWELEDSQVQDPILSGVLLYVLRKRLPSRCEQYGIDI